MAKFHKEYDNSGLADGDISVNSYNYYGTALQADGVQGASVIDEVLLINHDLFSCAQDDSNGDVLTLPAGLPTGTVISIIATGIFEITADGTTKINNEDAPLEVVMGANELIVFTKTLNGWIATIYSIAGAVSAANPD